MMERMMKPHTPEREEPLRVRGAVSVETIKLSVSNQTGQQRDSALFRAIRITRRVGFG